MNASISPAQRWQQIVASIQQELCCVPEDELQWIKQNLVNIHALQSELHQLFIAGDGLNQCQECQGDCCDLGNNHMTLVNVLSGLLFNNLPAANFAQSCPFMGAHGCTLAVQTRPFNCVTFICERIEARLSAEQCQEFYALEKQLRAQYQAFDQRYIGSSLRGLLIRSQSMPGSKFLAGCD
ncbi:MAG: hypothetical protein RBR22_11285 [Desulfuromonas sp.]|nr:hypothetical protein [Desulfuromonas sp.]